MVTDEKFHSLHIAKNETSYANSISTTNLYKPTFNTDSNTKSLTLT